MFLWAWSFTWVEYLLSDDKKHFSITKEYITNYIEFATLWWLWITIVETWNLDNLAWEYISWIHNVWSTLIEETKSNH